MTDLTDDLCPLCGADLQGGSRVIAIYSREKDRTVAYQCPDCGGRWDR